jgi:ribosomal protein L12E/L44/L45/RPP1/RPP2
MAVRKLASNSPTHFYSMPVADVGGLDPKVYRVSLTVERLDAEPLADEDCEEIERAFAALATAASPPAKAPPAKGKAASKGAGKPASKPASKSASKPASKPRKK